MNIISFVLLTVLCVGMCVISTIFSRRDSWQGGLIKCLTLLSIVALALICGNLRELNNALPIFVVLALVVELVRLCQAGENKNDSSDNKKNIVLEILNIAVLLMLVLSAITLAKFNLLALASGILLGGGGGLIFTAAKKIKDWKMILLNIAKYACLALVLAFSITALAFARHTVSSVVMLLGILCLLTSVIIGELDKKGTKLDYLAYALRLAALILIAVTIYFY